jgi:hypothetical protein
MMPRGWSSCASLPDDFEPEDIASLQARGCNWCYLDPSDPSCNVRWNVSGSTDWDQRNLRAFEQSRRFGVNGLWGRQRYVDAFTKSQVLGSDGNMGPNGLYAGGGRTPSMVVVAAIVGAPIDLVADPTTLAPKTLTELDWDLLVSPDHVKRDPHMIESTVPRAGIQRFEPSANPNAQAIPVDFADPINGGDRDIAGFADLEFACIGVRESTANDPNFGDCNPGGNTSLTSPLCGTNGTTQPRYKAYPGLRHLRILHEIGLTGTGVSTLVGSICAPSYAAFGDALVTAIMGTGTSANH